MYLFDRGVLVRMRQLPSVFSLQYQLQPFLLSINRKEKKREDEMYEIKGEKRWMCNDYLTLIFNNT